MKALSRKQSGAQAVEFALVLPLLLLIIFLVLDFGFIVYNKAILTNASREGARKATILSATWSAANATAAACAYASGLLINPGGPAPDAACTDSSNPAVTLTYPNNPPQFGDTMTITVNFTYTGFLNTGTGWLLNVPAWPLSAVARMNHE